MQMRRFEKLGMTRQQAEAMTEHLTGLLCLHTEKLAEEYVTKAGLEKVRSSDTVGFRVESLPLRRTKEQQQWLRSIRIPSISPESH